MVAGTNDGMDATDEDSPQTVFDGGIVLMNDCCDDIDLDGLVWCSMLLVLSTLVLVFTGMDDTSSFVKNADNGDDTGMDVRSLDGMYISIVGDADNS